MTYSNKTSKRVALCLVALMMLIIPNMKVYSAVGAYNDSSMAITANDKLNPGDGTNPEVGWPAAVAAGVVLGVVFVAGVVDGWNNAGGDDSPSPDEEPEEIARLTAFNADYHAKDFSDFDN